MRKDIDIKNRIVNLHDVDIGSYENEIVKFLDKQMKVRFHSAIFSNNTYIFIGKPEEQSSHSITVSSYRKRSPGDKISTVIEV